ncbi:hypothetical protein COCNU_14G007040 [Cocos nucifera]|uniref:Uncharacterized protein n=1 Tax=Cocos nucifera TaxID=13894 RepID=A0A8K0IV46_COCNU|nr:hypothetical protein COCNU_14G007040 [Cocos nucifera]
MVAINDGPQREPLFRLFSVGVILWYIRVSQDPLKTMHLMANLFKVIAGENEDEDSAMKVKTSLSKEGSHVIEEIINEEKEENEELNDKDHNDDIEDNFLGL